MRPYSVYTGSGETSRISPLSATNTTWFAARMQHRTSRVHQQYRSGDPIRCERYLPILLTICWHYAEDQGAEPTHFPPRLENPVRKPRKIMKNSQEIRRRPNAGTRVVESLPVGPGVARWNTLVRNEFSGIHQLFAQSLTTAGENVEQWPYCG